MKNGAGKNRMLETGIPTGPVKSHGVAMAFLDEKIIFHIIDDGN